mmetsp:Transcript_171576/g.549897  ORF Transcript_171576/g.549897 Transcript_171576/m.549897 type:complete len:221 (-) Transcript_171576:301-963(-)
MQAGSESLENTSPSRKGQRLEVGPVLQRVVRAKFSLGAERTRERKLPVAECPLAAGRRKHFLSAGETAANKGRTNSHGSARGFHELPQLSQGTSLLFENGVAELIWSTCWRATHDSGRATWAERSTARNDRTDKRRGRFKSRGIGRRNVRTPPDWRCQGFEPSEFTHVLRDLRGQRIESMSLTARTKWHCVCQTQVWAHDLCTATCRHRLGTHVPAPRRG